MCHLILALPLVALPMLWLLPANLGVPAYAVVLVLAIAVYWLAVRAMRVPVTTGVEALRGSIGAVLRVNGRSLRIWVMSELWSAKVYGEAVVVGDAVEVIDLDGLVLRVRKATPPVASNGTSKRAGRVIDPSGSSARTDAKGGQ